MEDDSRFNKKSKVPGEAQKQAAWGPPLQPIVGMVGRNILGMSRDTRTYRRAGSRTDIIGAANNHSSGVVRNGKIKDSSGCSKIATRDQ